jgi:hypothetical protein
MDLYSCQPTFVTDERNGPGKLSRLDCGSRKIGNVIRQIWNKRWDKGHNCCGEGEHATLRSTTSSSHHVHKGYIHRTHQNKPRAPTGRRHVRPLRSRVARRKPCRCLRTTRALTTAGGPCVIRPIVMGPARTSAIKAVSVIGFTLMTICNLPSWEYSGDKPDTRGSKRLWQGQAVPRVPMNTSVQCPYTGRLMKLLSFHAKLCKHTFHFPVGLSAFEEKTESVFEPS